MKLRATLKIRNDHMISARSEHGWSQGRLAKAAGVPVAWVYRLEKLDFSGNPDLLETHAYAVAATLGIPVEQVLPDGFAGKRLETTMVSISEVDALSLPFVKQKLLVERDPAHSMILKEELGVCLEGMDERHKSVLVARYGLNGSKEKSPSEIAEDMNCSRTRVDQIIKIALRRAKARYTSRMAPRDVR